MTMDNQGSRTGQKKQKKPFVSSNTETRIYRIFDKELKILS